MNDNSQTPKDVTDVRLKAVGNLAFLLSVIRCGEQLSEAEESCIRATIQELKDSASTDELSTLKAQLEDAERVIDSLIGPFDQVPESYRKGESYRVKYPKEG